MKKSRTENLPLLPLRDVVIFPSVVTPLFVARDKSKIALQASMAADVDKQIMLVAQKEAQKDDPNFEDLHGVGTVASILQLIKLPDGTVKVLVEGNQRARIEEIKDFKDYDAANITLIEDEEETPTRRSSSSTAVFAAPSSSTTTSLRELMVMILNNNRKRRMKTVVKMLARCNNHQ